MLDKSFILFIYVDSDPSYLDSYLEMTSYLTCYHVYLDSFLCYSKVAILRRPLSYHEVNVTVMVSS